MLSIIINACVKAVFLSMSKLVLSCAPLYTVIRQSVSGFVISVVKLGFIQVSKHSLVMLYSTAKKRVFSLLNFVYTRNPQPLLLNLIIKKG